MAEGGFQQIHATGDTIASNVLDSHLLECPICLEQLRRPKSLPCRHTFCQECLGTYITKELSGKKASATSFPCPVCLELTQPVNQSEDKAKWAQQFRPDSVIQQRLRIQEGQTLYCETCLQKSKTKTRSTIWCETCIMPLCESCKIFLHDELLEGCTLVDISVVKRKQDPQASQYRMNSEGIEFYCDAHMVQGCNICNNWSGQGQNHGQGHGQSRRQHSGQPKYRDRGRGRGQIPNDHGNQPNTGGSGSYRQSGPGQRAQGDQPYQPMTGGSGSYPQSDRGPRPQGGQPYSSYQPMTGVSGNYPQGRQSYSLHQPITDGSSSYTQSDHGPKAQGGQQCPLYQPMSGGSGSYSQGNGGPGVQGSQPYMFYQPSGSSCCYPQSNGGQRAQNCQPTRSNQPMTDSSRSCPQCGRGENAQDGTFSRLFQSLRAKSSSLFQRLTGDSSSGPKRSGVQRVQAGRPYQPSCVFDKATAAYTFCGKLKVFVYQRNILQCPVDAIVATEDINFDHSDGISQTVRIEEAVGHLYWQAFKDWRRGSHGSLQVGQVLEGEPGNLDRLRCIYHVIMEKFLPDVPPTEKQLQYLRTSVHKVLMMANYWTPKPKRSPVGTEYNKPLHKIAMSIPGAGLLTTPLYVERCCEAMFDTITDFTRKTERVNLKEVHIVDLRQADIIDILQTTFQKCVLRQQPTCLPPTKNHPQTGAQRNPGNTDASNPGEVGNQDPEKVASDRTSLPPAPSRPEVPSGDPQTAVQRKPGNTDASNPKVGEQNIEREDSDWVLV